MRELENEPLCRIVNRFSSSSSSSSSVAAAGAAAAAAAAAAAEAAAAAQEATISSAVSSYREQSLTGRSGAPDQKHGILASPFDTLH